MTKRVLFQRVPGAVASFVHVVLRKFAGVEVKVLMREAAEHPSSRLSERHFFDYIPPTEKETNPTQPTVLLFATQRETVRGRSFSSAFTLMRLRAKTAWFWLHATTAILTVRCPQRYFHGDQRRI
ncbi:hypothetical protein TNCV_4871871 [Trichonephila clavipes]|nr:hypothetical protein TNCV_4871871 [Trichonephila clavipes]